MTARELLLAAVGRARRRAFVLGSLRAALAGLTGLAAAPLASAFLLPWLPAPERTGPWVAGGFLALGLILGAWLAAAEWRKARPRVSPARAAELLAGSEPDLADLVVTGTDLAAWGEKGAAARGASPDLVLAQVERAAGAAEGLDPARAFPARAAAPWALRAAGVAALLALWLTWDPGASVGAWATLLGGGAPEPVAVGNLTLVYTPPAYTGLPQRTVEGSDGSVEGYPGTRVTLSGRLSRPLEAGEWQGPGERAVPLAMASDAFTVSWILDRAGPYRLRFTRRGEEVPSDFSGGSIALLQDNRPKVTLKAPEGDLELTTDQEVEVAFEASDDFRVERVELVLQGDEEVRIPVTVEAGPKVEGRARFLPLSYPTLGAGAHVRVEAWDGDTVSGPKTGASRSVYVSFLDKRRLLSDIEGLEDRLLEALITHLADHLEAGDGTPAPEVLDRLRQKARDLLRLFEQLAERVRLGADQGSLGSLAVLRMEQGLRGTLEPFLQEGGERREAIVAEVERDVLFLDRLLQSLRMEQALSLGDELSALQRSLYDDLQAGAKPEDLLAKVNQLQDLLAKMAEKMSRSAGEMPDAFANADAVREMPSGELQKALEELREALRQGDMEKAQQLAEQLLETLGQMMAALEEAAQGASRAQMDPMMKELLDLQQEVSDLSAEQERILQETQAVGREASRRAARSLQEEMESFLERQDKRLQVIEEAARLLESVGPRASLHHPPMGGLRGLNAPGPLDFLESRRRVGAAAAEVREALREDLGRAREGGRTLQEAFGDLRQQVAGTQEPGSPQQDLAERYAQTGEKEIEGLLADLDALAARRAEGLSAGEKEGLKGLSGRQGQAGERAGGVAERLKDLAGRTPLLDPGLAGKARSAQGAMGEAGAKLDQGNPFGATPPEARALEHLAEISRGLESARQQVGQGMGGSGLQMVRMPGGQRPGMGREVDQSPVEIPKETEARELKAFREEVLKAMRSGRYPKDYEREVEKYYERLIR